MDALTELVNIRDRNTFLELLGRRPELLSRKTITTLALLSEHFAYGATYDRLHSLLMEARTSPGRAWQQYEAAQAALVPIRNHLSATMQAILGAERRRAFQLVVELTEDAIPRASHAGLGDVTCELLQRRGLAWYYMGSERRAEELDLAIDALEQAVEAAGTGKDRASALTHLGMVVAERVHGDRAENLERAILVMREALRVATESGSAPPLKAMLQTNLAVTLYRRERGDRAANLREAVSLCRAALEYRRPNRDANDWAYSQINLGNALDALAGVGKARPQDAREAYLRVVAESQEISERWLVGEAHHMLGRAALRRAHRTAEDIVADFEARLREPPDSTSVLVEARDHLVHARDLCRDGVDQIRNGMILEALSDALTQLGAGDFAIEVMREALTILRPRTSPRPCADTAARLGGLFSERGQWSAAADAYRVAVEASELIFHSRLDTTSREEETRRGANLHRWAAYAFARAGRPEEAATALENGRGRELRRRLGLPVIANEAKEGIPRALQTEYQEAVDAFLTAPIDSNGGAAARRLQNVVQAIRALPGLEDFAASVRWKDISAALEPGWGLVYVDPTPSGTLLLCVVADEQSSEPCAEAVFIDVTSQDLMMLLMTSLTLEGEPPATDDGTPYLLAISGEVETQDFQSDLDRVLPLLGECLSRPLRDALTRYLLEGVTVVLCGPIAAAPVHAAYWEESDERRCLLDYFDLRQAPSALVAGTAQRRAGQAASIQPRLVALSDPTEDLPGARPEVEEIAAQFVGKVYAFGADANRDFLRRYATKATHLHLACHASGGLFDASQAAIFLASGPLPAVALTALGGLSTRLVVISACQSALSEIAGLPEETLSIATIALAAGSACAVASLWLVDDLATAFLMTRMYEEMFVGHHAPPSALRRAQLWLRDLTEEAERRFLDQHAALDAVFRSRAAAGNSPGRRGSSNAGPDGRKPYGHADYWAPFIAVGA